MTTPEDAHFLWPVRVYYEDTDAGGIVYNASYLRFMERARTEWLRSLGFDHGRLRDADGLQLVLSRAALEFHAPARLDDPLQVSVRLLRLRRASLDLEQRVFSSAAQPLCSARIQVACVDTRRQRPRPFPPAFSGVLA